MRLLMRDLLSSHGAGNLHNAYATAGWNLEVETRRLALKQVSLALFKNCPKSIQRFESRVW